MADVYFADVKVERLEAEKTLPSKFRRLIDRMDIKELVKGKKVCIKMHFGGNLGFTTIHPLFIRLLVEKIKKAGAKKVFVADGHKKKAHFRGYTRKSLGCAVVGLFNRPNATKTIPIGYKKLDEAHVSKVVLNSDVLIVLSHVKGHGDCGFGGAGKNIAMGIVPGKTRRKLHSLEGGIEWNEEKCIHCNKCIEECPNNANKFNEDGKYEIFLHNCTLCRHCELICPEKAIITTNITFSDFQHGMALLNKKVLDYFDKNIYYINFLTNITVFCDCWGFSTASLVPDIGILGSKDIVSIEMASLDLIKTEDVILDNNGHPVGLSSNRNLGEGDHLFEKIHGKNPYLMAEFMQELGLGSKEYKILKID